MKNLLKGGRMFYGIGIAGLGIQQFMYADFRPVLLPDWPLRIPWPSVWAYLTGTALVAAGILLTFTSHARKTAILTGLSFLLFFILFHVPYQLFFSPFQFHLGSWSDALKELALSGGGWVIAGSYPPKTSEVRSFIFFPDNPARWGIVFFSVMLITFGTDHFIYTKFVASLVPTWIPWPYFWTYFAGIALAGAGLSLLLNIKMKVVALLLGIMLFLWFVVLHMPRAIAAPYIDKGNEVTSVFEALAFSGISFVIACLNGDLKSPVS